MIGTNTKDYVLWARNIGQHNASFDHETLIMDRPHMSLLVHIASSIFDVDCLHQSCLVHIDHSLLGVLCAHRSGEFSPGLSVSVRRHQLWPTRIENATSTNDMHRHAAHINHGVCASN